MQKMKLNIQLFGTWGSDTKLDDDSRVWGAVGYSSVTRSGNTITVTWGSRIKTNYSTYGYQLRGSTYWKLYSGSSSNSGGGTGTRYYGYAKTGIGKNTWYYTKNGNTSSTNTTERYDYTATLTLPSASTTSATLTSYVWGSTAGGCYPTVTVSFGAATAPTISTSSHSSTSASRGSANGSHSWSISATSGNYSSITSYSSSCNGGTSSSTTPSFGSLYNNTTYSWSSIVYNNAGLSASTSGTFYLTPVVPTNPTIGTVTNFVRSGDYYSATASMSASYDKNRAWSRWNVNGVTLSSQSSSQISLSSLSPNTSYTITASTVDANSGGPYSTALSSGTSTRTFTTPCKIPSGLTVSLTGQTTTSLSGTISANGDINAPITQYILYYATGDNFDQWIEQGYTIASMILDGLLDQATLSGTNWSTTGLSIDTEYIFILRAVNAGGTATAGITSGEAVIRYSTNLDAPIINSFITTSVMPSLIMVAVDAYSASGRALNYQYSIDNGSTWSSYGTDTTYLWENLNPNTHYTIKVRVKAIASGSGSDSYAIGTIEVTTPSDQAKIRLKVNGEWEKGLVYIKINGTWTAAKKIYRKVNGTWVCGYNYDHTDIAIDQNMNNWTATHADRGVINYDSSTGLNTVTVTGSGGWEKYYIPITCTVGKRYKVDIDWQTPSGYSPYSASGLTGIYAVIYDGVPTTTTNNTIADQTNSSKRLSLPVDYTGSTYSMTFRATTTTEYLAFNFGGLTDGALYAASFRIKNIKVTYYEN